MLSFMFSYLVMIKSSQADWMGSIRFLLSLDGPGLCFCRAAHHFNMPLAVESYPVIPKSCRGGQRLGRLPKNAASKMPCATCYSLSI